MPKLTFWSESKPGQIKSRCNLAATKVHSMVIILRKCFEGLLPTCFWHPVKIMLIKLGKDISVLKVGDISLNSLIAVHQLQFYCLEWIPKHFRRASEQSYQRIINNLCYIEINFKIRIPHWEKQLTKDNLMWYWTLAWWKPHASLSTWDFKMWAA